MAGKPFNSILLAVFAAAVLTIPFLTGRPFATRGEGREVLVAQSIVEHGEWLLGRGYAGVVPSKPPFLHWFVAFFSIPMGTVSEFSARLPSCLASVLFIWYFAKFLERRKGGAIALLSSMVLVTSIEWFRAATVCRVDMLLSALLGAGLLALYDWYEKRLEGFPIVAIVTIAGAALTKGPVGIALPGLIFVIFLIWQKVSWSKLVVACLTVFPPALLIATIWYGLAYIDRGQEFFYKVYYENISRLTSTQEDMPHKHSAFYLLGTVVLGFLPWSFWLAPSICKIKKFNWRATLPNDPMERFFFVSIVIVFCFFCVPAGKRSVYLLPIYPFISYFLAAWIVNFYGKFGRVVSAALAGVLAIILILSIFAAVSPKLLSTLNNSEFFVTLFNSLWFNFNAISTYWMWGLLIVCCGALIFNSKLQSPIQNGLLYVVILMGVSGSLIAGFSTSTSSESFARELHNSVAPDKSIYSYQNEFYALSFYLDREIQRLESKPIKDSVVVLYEENLPQLKEALEPSQSLEFVARSSGSIEKIGARVVVVRVVES